jgi:hypothetical protein
MAALAIIGRWSFFHLKVIGGRELIMEGRWGVKPCPVK